jgi:fluoride exporter
MFLEILAVFLGGGLGAVCRYLLGVFVKINSVMPLPTFTANFLGCLIIGFLSVLFMDKVEINGALKIGLTVGFCGGFTTFSTFSAEIFDMLKHSNFTMAILYIIISVVICLTAVLIGATLAKYL